MALAAAAHSEPLTVHAQRFPANPLITPDTPGVTSHNINGPSLLRVPDWIPQPLGRYYLYFADHRGQRIHLAYANDPQGPWTVHPPGTLRLDQTACVDHIASPDVHVDPQRRQIIMYFHGVPAEKNGQKSYVATSPDGLNFTASPQVLGPFYFRVFQHRGWFYAIAKNKNDSGVLLRSRDGVTAFERGPEFIPRLRHTALHVQGDQLLLFYTLIGDAPESILFTRLDLARDWTQWEASMSPPQIVLQPQADYEGIAHPVAPSTPGPTQSARQLRDPGLFIENDHAFLFYSIAGESGLAGATLRFEKP